MIITDGKVRKGNYEMGKLEKQDFDEIMPQNEHVQTDKFYNVVEFDCKYMTTSISCGMAASCCI